MNSEGTQLVVVFAFLQRVSEKLKLNSRAQLLTSDLTEIVAYLQKAYTKMSSFDNLKPQLEMLMEFTDLATNESNKGEFIQVSNVSRENINNKFLSLYYASAVGISKELTETEFDYKENMKPVLTELVDLALGCGYYFEF